MAVMTRVDRLREGMSRLGLDAFLISQPESRRYLSGFTGHDHPPMDSAGYLLITEAKLLLFTDGRTTEQAAQEAPEYEVIRIQEKLPITLSQIAPGLSASRLAFEGNHLTYRLYEETRTALGEGFTMVPTYNVVDTMRAVKDPDELEAIEEAVLLADKAFTHAVGVITAGMTEREMAWEIEAFMRKHGSEGVAFDTIVASGPNASRPHHIPGDRPLQTGEPIIIDWGAKVNGYCSDITRTVVLGEADKKFKALYKVVLDAQVRAEERIRAGMTGAKADNLARKVIEAAGYGEQFGHGLGHGVGIAIHESPRLGRASEDVLEDGMVFSVEPGVYLPGWGGIRIEDLVILQGGRVTVLSHAPKQLETMEV
jgi:Xaa-Pro aminopeptidase